MASPLLERLEKIGIFPESELQELRELAAQFSDPKALATELVRQGKLTRWQAGQLLLGRNVVLGKYFLIDALSPDEVNPLFLAEHRAMERRVVLRVLAKQLSQEEKWRDRFLAEAQLWASIDHPRIVQAYNAEQDAGRYFLVLEYISGDSLDQLIRESGPLPPEGVMQLAAEAAEGLQTLHSRGIVHGNLRPTKLMITPEGNVKLLDRGFSLWIRQRDLAAGVQPRGEQDIKKSERLTPWHAPEVHRGQQATVHSDLYSLGACLFYAATGKALPIPVDQTSPGDWLATYQAELGDHPPELVELISRLLALEVKERGDSVEWVVEYFRRRETASVTASTTEDTFQASPSIPEEPQVQEAVPFTETPREPAALVEAVSPFKPGEIGAIGVSAVAGESGPAARLLDRSKRSAKWATTGAAWWSWIGNRWKGLTGRQRVLVLGSVAGGLLVFLIAIAGLVWFLGGGSQDQTVVAKTETARAVGENQTEPHQEAEEESPFPKIEPDLNFDPTRFNGPSPAWAEGSQATEGVGGQTRPEQPGEKAPLPAGGTQQGEPSPPSENAPSTATESPAMPQGQEAAGPSSPAAAENKSPPPEGAQQQAENQSAVPPDKKPEQPSQPPKSEPLFAGLPASVELPECTSVKEGEEDPLPFEIGRIGGGESITWQLILLGGNTALRKGTNFILAEVVAPGSPPHWVVQAETAAGTGKPQQSPVGKFFREGNLLYFQWDRQAQPAIANALRNCLLQVRAGSESRYVRLRQPVAYQMPPIDLTRPAINVNITAKYLPDEAFLQWELIDLEGFENALQVEPKLPAPPKGAFTVYVMRKDRDGNSHREVPIRITFSIRGQVLNVRLQVASESSLLRAIPRDKTQFTIARNAVEQQREAVLKRLNPPNKEQAPRGAERTKLLSELRALEQQLWFFEFYEKVHGKARVRFRIFSEVAGQKLVFIET